MRLLLDTNVLLWWLADDPRLSTPVRAAIAAPQNEVLVSVVSLWEMAVKQRIGKLTADIREILAAVAAGGFTRLAITDAHLTALMGLPAYHRDLFDHLLMAQVLAERAVFCSADEMAGRYGVEVMC